jgi:hypothetical protein
VRESDVFVTPGTPGGPGRQVRAIPIAPDRLWMTGRAGELVLTRDAAGLVTAVGEAGSNQPPAQREAKP